MSAVAGGRRQRGGVLVPFDVGHAPRRAGDRWDGVTVLPSVRPLPGAIQRPDRVPFSAGALPRCDAIRPSTSHHARTTNTHVHCPSAPSHRLTCVCVCMSGIAIGHRAHRSDRRRAPLVRPPVRTAAFHCTSPPIHRLRVDSRAHCTAHRASFCPRPSLIGVSDPIAR